MTKKELGAWGEKIAAKFLIKKGYQIIAKNFRSRHGEIDIVAKDPDTQEIIFVEVKTRINLNYGYPEEAVNNLKKYRLEHAAEKFLWSKNYSIQQNYRFDAIAIEINSNKKQAKIKHLECV